MNHLGSSRSPRARPGRVVALAVAAALSALTTVPTAAGQIVYAGDTRVEMSDVSGPPLTSGDMLGPGTVRSFTCPVAWAVRTAAEGVGAGLQATALPVVAAGLRGESISAEVSRDLFVLLTDGEDDDAAARRLSVELAPESGGGAAARDAAGELVERLDGLLENAGRLRPERPGHRTATQLAGAVGAYNRYVEEVSTTLLASPPDALLAIQAVLSPLVIAALENDGRPASSAARGGGLACAAPPASPPTPAPPAPPIERATVVCVIDARGLRAVGAIVLSSGDTVVAVDGRRIPLADAFPTTAQYAADAAWYAQGDEFTVNGRRYLRFGLPRLAAADADLRRVGEFAGVPLFSAPGEDRLIIPVRPNCLVQEYRPEQTLRPRG